MAYSFIGISSVYQKLLQSGSADTLASSLAKMEKVAAKSIDKFIESQTGD